MNEYVVRDTNAFRVFSIASFTIAVLMMAGGIWFMEGTVAAKGYYAMAAFMLVQTSISVTKSMRDAEEQGRMHNRIEEARTERLLTEPRHRG